MSALIRSKYIDYYIEKVTIVFRFLRAEVIRTVVTSCADKLK